MSIWFWIFAVLSTFGFALQWALMTKYVRKWDPLSMTTYRSLSLGISMMPLLLLSSPENIKSILYYQPQILLSWVCIILNVWCLYASYKVLPIWISWAMRALFSTIWAIVFWLFFFKEYLEVSTIIFIWVALLWWIILWSAKSDFSHLEVWGFIKWIMLSAFSWLLSSLAVVLMVQISRNLDPFVISYFWELEAAFIWLLFLWIRKIYYGKWIEKISKIDFLKILWASSPTLVWTLCLALASLYWPIGIASAVGTLGIVFITIFWVLLFGERLRWVQYFWMSIIIFWILGIKLI